MRIVRGSSREPLLLARPPRSTDASSATRPTRALDCNQSATAGFAAAPDC